MLNRLTNNSIFATLILSSAVFSPLMLAADSAPVDPKIAKNIIITGCLHAGEHSGQFVLVGVTERTLTGKAVPVPYAIYTLDSTRDMKPLVGQLVDVTGVVVSRDKERGTIKIDVGGDAESTTAVAVDTASRSVTTKSFAGTSAPESVVELSRPVYRVGVDSIKPVRVANGSPACR